MRNYIVSIPAHATVGSFLANVQSVSGSHKQNALNAYNRARNNKGLRSLARLPAGVQYTKISSK